MRFGGLIERQHGVHDRHAAAGTHAEQVDDHHRPQQQQGEQRRLDRAQHREHHGDVADHARRSSDLLVSHIDTQYAHSAMYAGSSPRVLRI